MLAGNRWTKSNWSSNSKVSNNFFICSAIYMYLILTNELLVEKYAKEVENERYFDVCGASSSTYSSMNELNAVNGVTYLIELYGGLMIICHVTAVLMVKMWQSKRREVNPTTA